MYDDYCPLCNWYVERGKDEIPLVDVEEKQTLYGIDALLEILGAPFPIIYKKSGKIKAGVLVFKKTISLYYLQP